MSKFNWSIPHRSRLFLGLTLTALWFMTVRLLYPQSTVFPTAQFLFALMTGMTTELVLDAFGHSKGFRPRNPLGDFVSICLAMPIPALLSKLSIGVFFEVPVLRHSDLALFLPLVAFASVIIQQIAAVRLNLGERRYNLVIAVREGERTAIRRELIRLGIQFELTPATRLNWMLRTDQRVDLIVISRGAVRDFERNSALLSAHLHGIAIIDFRAFLNELQRRIRTERTDVWTFLTFALPQTPTLRMYAAAKQLLEPLLAIFLLMLLGPVMLGVATAIRWSGPGPILYRQKRTGHLGRSFELVKFRSMSQDAEKDGPQWAALTDRRVTRIGAFLRAAHLDELPQLFNVIRGEMSFVGPRPERAEFYRRLKKDIPLFHLRTLVRPGVTGWAQLEGGYANSVEQSRLKLEYDLYYIQKASPQLDSVILLRTVSKAIRSLIAPEKSVPVSAPLRVLTNEALIGEPMLNEPMIRESA